MITAFAAMVRLDMPVGWMLFYYGMTGIIAALSLVIFLAEGLVLHWFKVGRGWTSLGHSFWMNAASGFLGFLTAIVLERLSLDGMFPYGPRPDQYAYVDVIGDWYLMDDTLIPAIPTTAMFLLLAYVISLFSEAVLLRTRLPSLDSVTLWRAVVIANAASYAILFTAYLMWPTFRDGLQLPF